MRYGSSWSSFASAEAGDLQFPLGMVGIVLLDTGNTSSRGGGWGASSTGPSKRTNQEGPSQRGRTGPNKRRGLQVASGGLKEHRLVPLARHSPGLPSGSNYRATRQTT
jgi:hypothetical protein